MDIDSSINKLTRYTMMTINIPWDKIICSCFIIIVILSQFINTGFVPTESMDPTIKMNSRIWYKRIWPMINSFNVKDIIVFHPTEAFYYHEYGDSETKLLVKRVVGVPVSVIHICRLDSYSNLY